MDIEGLVKQISEKLNQQNRSMVTAESCTGGWVAKLITDQEGSSAWFDRGVVCYSNRSKSDMLGVDHELINDWGAVSEPVAQSMAVGALAHSEADYSLAITGIAGPGGGSQEKPVGMVCFGWAVKKNEMINSMTTTQYFSGNREEVRLQAAQFSLLKLKELIAS